LVNILVMAKDLLKVHPFHDFSPADLQIIEPYFSYLNAVAGSVLFSQGDPAEKLYIVVRGELAVKYKPYDSPEIVITRLKEDDVVGWSTVLGNSSYTSSAICVTDVEVLQITGTCLRKLIKEHPQTGTMVMDRLADAVSPRWKNAQSQVRAMLRKGVELPVQFDGDDNMDESSAKDPEREAQLKALVEQLSAYIETYHGGSVDYVGMEKDTLRVHLGGACLGCPLSPATLHGWVEGTVKQFFPEIAHVEAV
jgi:CRP-like cAMP-binding protein